MCGYPDWDEAYFVTPDQLDAEAEQLLVKATVRLPEYGIDTPEDGLLVLSSALDRLGFAFFRPDAEHPCVRVIPQAVIEEATSLQLRADEDRRGVVADEDSEEEEALTVDRYAQLLRDRGDRILAERGNGIRQRVAAAVRRAG